MPLNIVEGRPAPFYFRRYGSVISVAYDLIELECELRRLARDDPRLVEYHLKEGHIALWLESIGEVELASDLKEECDIEQAGIKVRRYLDRKNPRSRGRASMRVPPRHRTQA